MSVRFQLRIHTYRALILTLLRRIDTAQAYGNEGEAGAALKESGLAREDIFVTTKFSGRDNLSIRESIDGSLQKVWP
jgi:diketogulonate reductase-like aldo/keto reductase